LDRWSTARSLAIASTIAWRTCSCRCVNRSAQSTAANSGGLPMLLDQLHGGAIRDR
jgi:hypothetical protein